MDEKLNRRCLDEIVCKDIEEGNLKWRDVVDDNIEDIRKLNGNNSSGVDSFFCEEKQCVLDKNDIMGMAGLPTFDVIIKNFVLRELNEINEMNEKRLELKSTINNKIKLIEAVLVKSDMDLDPLLQILNDENVLENNRIKHFLDSVAAFNLSI